MDKKNEKRIFDIITWETSKQINELIDNMDDEQVRFFTIRALESSFNRGTFNILESEIVSKLIRKISYQEPSADDIKHEE